MSRPRISSNRIWKNHEERVLRVLERALALLAAKENLDVGENDLNREFTFCIREANADLRSRNEDIPWSVTPEGNNPPDASDEERTVRENKRPDFQWSVIDTKEKDPKRQDKYFVIECKRLGTPLRKNWVFNENYVRNGILRFISPEHGYGKSATSGAMVGYIRAMHPKDILNEVNHCATKEGLPRLILAGKRRFTRPVSRLEQKLERQEVAPENFALYHLWGDFRAK